MNLWRFRTTVRAHHIVLAMWVGLIVAFGTVASIAVWRLYPRVTVLLGNQPTTRSLNSALGPDQGRSNAVNEDTSTVSLETVRAVMSAWSTLLAALAVFVAMVAGLIAYTQLLNVRKARELDVLLHADERYSSSEMHQAVAALMTHPVTWFDDDRKKEGYRRRVLHFWEIVAAAVTHATDDTLLRSRFKDQIRIWEKLRIVHARHLLRRGELSDLDEKARIRAIAESIRRSNVEGLYVKWQGPAGRAAPCAEEPTRDAIARRAFQLYLQRGAVTGRDVDDWAAAEAELWEAYFKG